MMPERASRTFICSVLFLDIVEYSRKPVAEQIRLKDRFNAMITSAIREIPPADRIILDTGDGVAINFLGDPEDALFVAMSLRDAFAPDINEAPEVPARIGINLGPVRLVRDLNAQPNIIGDGINVAQRVMAFASTGQILVSRSYYEIVSHMSEGYSKLFSYEGSRTDKHVREHEVYSVGYSTADPAIRWPAGSANRATGDDLHAKKSTSASVSRLMEHVERWLGNRSLAYGTAAFSTATFLLALLTSFLGQTPQEPGQSRDASVPKKLASTPIKKIGTVSDNESPLTSGIAKEERQERKAGPNDVADAAEEPSAPAPARKKLRLPFFGSSPEEEPGNSSPQQAPTEQTQKQLPPEEPVPVATREKEGVAGSASAQKQTSAWTAASQPIPAATGRATVSLAITPWGEVYIDGKLIGVSPPVNEIQVVPGQRNIEIRNGDFPAYTQRVELKARQRIKIRYKFN